MTQAPEREPTIADVLQRLDRLADDVEATQSTIVNVVQRLDKLSADVEKSNDKFEVYRQANQSLVNLAFGLIASATVATVVSLIFRR